MNKVLFSVIALFWVTMNVLLWQVEFGPARRAGHPVSTAVVWHKILTAPDESSLELRRNGEKIGYCHWVAGTAEEMTLEDTSSAPYEPEGMVRNPSGYVVHLEGNFIPEGNVNRVRFSLRLLLSTDRTWQELTLRLGNRPALWEIQAQADTETVELRYGSEPTQWTRRFTFAELEDPHRLIEELGGPLALGLLAPLKSLVAPSPAGMTVEWDARTDWLKLGQTRVSAYRLHLRLVDRYEAQVVVNRVGEIMRVILPGGFEAVNEVLVNL